MATRSLGMEIHDIDRESSIPIYVQLRDMLKAGIRRSGVRAFQKLPSENELSGRHGISRMTVRHAIRELEREGYVYTRKGEGTYVSDGAEVQMLIKLDGFSTEMRKQGRRVHSEFLESKTVNWGRGHGQAYAGLREKRENPIVVIKRIRHVDDTPFAVEVSYLNYRVGKPLLPLRMDRGFSIYRYIEQNQHIRLSRAEHMIEPRKADRRTAKQLKIKPGSLILSVSGTSYSTRGEPVEYLEGLYIGDKYKLKVSISK